MADHTDKPGRQPGLLERIYGAGSPSQPEGGEPEKKHSAFYGESSSPAMDWINSRLARVMRDADFGRALRAITERGSTPPSVIQMVSPLLVSLAILAVSPHRVNRASWENLWTYTTGKTSKERKSWKALKDFPGRIKGMAHEIELVNGSTFFAPATFVNVKTPQAQIVRRRFEQLPAIMRLYAEGLRQQIQRVPVLSAKAIPSIQRGGDDTLVSLSSVIKTITGKWLDRQGADLLNAAAVALGVERQFEALTIAQARSRWKKKKT